MWIVEITITLQNILWFYKKSYW